VIVVTQNIDDLHERAGSKNVVHMHGKLLEARCTACKKVIACTEDLSAAMICSACRSPGALRPNVVWFGEEIPALDSIYPALQKCDLFIAIGTSGTVYPAAAFVIEAKTGNAYTVELNLEPSSVSPQFDKVIEGPASVVVPQFIGELLTHGCIQRDRG
jgi:NAD-dependent deacetylase